MAKNIYIGVAWPYASGDRHLGHAAGFAVPCDIFARYHRLRGRRVLMVSGTDEHGTPITLKAIEEKKSPAEVVDFFNKRIRSSLVGLGVSYDWFTRTTSETHSRVVQEIFDGLYKNGFILEDDVDMLFCLKEGIFLPDRYVEGVCPYCDFEGARGDQCDNCGRLIDPLQLKSPKCNICGSAPEARTTKHLFFDLPQFEGRLREWLGTKEYWRHNPLNFSIKFLESGLERRAISRNIDWGVPIRHDGFEDKKFYVWFEAVIGYLSATHEWARVGEGNAEAWREWWKNPDTEHTYFLAKDNTLFHTVMWPAMLMGQEGGYNLPYNVPANEYLQFKGKQFSTSRKWSISLNDFLDNYDPDPLRYYLTMNAPESADTNFTWDDFIRRNNTELAAAWGNLVHRTLTFTLKKLEGKVPKPHDSGDPEERILNDVDQTFSKTAAMIENCQFKFALESIMELVRQTNQYIDKRAPWKDYEKNRSRCDATIYTTISVIDSIKVLLSPFLPFSSQRVHEYLGYRDMNLFGRIETTIVEDAHGTHEVSTYCQGTEGDHWRALRTQPGQVIERPEPLYKVLEPPENEGSEY